MSLLPCSKCCTCPACPDAPKKLRVNISYPQGSGTTFQPDYYGAVATDCEPPADGQIVSHGIIDSRGYGYTEAPTPSVSVSESQSPPSVEVIVEGPAVGATVTNGGSGYTSAPEVRFRDWIGNLFDDIAVAIIEGSIDSVSVTSRGVDYDTPPEVRFLPEASPPASATATLTQYVKEVEVLNGGGGYEQTPSVVIDGSAAGTCVMRRRLLSVNVVNGGSGYTSPPEVFVSGGAIVEAVVSGGSVVSANVIDQGSSTGGFSFFLFGGGGSGAELEAGSTNRFVHSIDLSTGGTDYSSAPSVTITANGSGSGATARAVMAQHVQSISINSAGGLHPESVAVSLVGGGGSGAEATATIDGSVTSIQIVDGSRVFEDSSGGSEQWPTIEFSGGGGSGAAATPVFSARLSQIFASGGQGITSTLPVTFTGGGGAGAAARVFPLWSQQNTLEYEITQEACRVVDSITRCMSTTLSSGDWPPRPCLACGGQPVQSDAEPTPTQRYGEALQVRFWADFTGEQVWPQGSSDWEPEDTETFFADEAAYIRWRAAWGEAFNLDGSLSLASAYTENYEILRRFHRVSPVGRLELGGSTGDEVQALSYPIASLPLSASQAGQPAVLQPIYEQSLDIKGDPIWKIIGYSVVSRGFNLRFTTVQSVGLSVSESSSSNIAFLNPLTPTADLTVGFVPPVPDIRGTVLGQFEQLPQISFGFTQIPDAFAPGRFSLTSVSVVNGGDSGGFVSDGQYSFALTDFSVGYFNNFEPATVLVSVSSGVVSAVSIVQAGETYGGGYVLAASVPEPSNPGEYAALFVTGVQPRLPEPPCSTPVASWDTRSAVISPYEGAPSEQAVGQTRAVSFQAGCDTGGPSFFVDGDRTRRCGSPTVTFEVL